MWQNHLPEQAGLCFLCAPRVGGWWQEGDATQNPGMDLPAALWGAERPQHPLQLQATILRPAWPEWRSLMCNYFVSAVTNVLLSSEGWGGSQRDSLHPWVIFSAHISCFQILSLHSLLSADTSRNLAAVLILFSMYPRAWELTESFAKRTKNSLIFVLSADVFWFFHFSVKNLLCYRNW